MKYLILYSSLLGIMLISGLVGCAFKENPESRPIPTETIRASAIITHPMIPSYTKYQVIKTPISVIGKWYIYIYHSYGYLQNIIELLSDNTIYMKDHSIVDTKYNGEWSYIETDGWDIEIRISSKLGNSRFLGKFITTEKINGIIKIENEADVSWYAEKYKPFTTTPTTSNQTEITITPYLEWNNVPIMNEAYEIVERENQISYRIMETVDNIYNYYNKAMHILDYSIYIDSDGGIGKLTVYTKRDSLGTQSIVTITIFQDTIYEDVRRVKLNYY
jgi:hypothetical protein